MSVAAEPNWLYPWQHHLASWLKTLELSDVETEISPVQHELIDRRETRRNLTLSRGYANPMISKVAGAIDLPDEAFLWTDGIWRSALPLVQGCLTDSHHPIRTGQIWIPSHPNSANWLAWAYSYERPWNPYYRKSQVAYRAAVISVVDLLMQAENDYWNNDKRSDKPEPHWAPHSGILGFTLTFNAFTLLHTRDALPEEVRDAWREGLKHLCGRVASAAPCGPTNMRLSFPVALYYAYLATDDPDFLKMYRREEARVVFGPKLAPSGVYLDGGAPDASYNGIALHRIAELYSINPTPELRQLLRRAYRLMLYMSLPEPDGSWVSPSHFNDRCAGSFANDQYSGREVQVVLDVPEAAPFLRHRWKAYNPEIEAMNIGKWSTRPSTLVEQPTAWGTGKRLHDWQGLLMLPYLLYHQDDADVSEAVTNAPALPIVERTHYTENFSEQFFAVRRPAYGALFYAGPANRTDRGTTNYRGMLNSRGGWFNGFAGGGMSAFWTPEAGALVLGRMNQYENYERDVVTVNQNDYHIPGWQDWANNHIIGKTAEGKVLTSARCPNPEGRLLRDGGLLEIRGVMPNELERQGRITEAQVSYTRRYHFNDDHIVCELSIETDRLIEFAELFETLPVRAEDDCSLRFTTAAGDVSETDEGYLDDITAVHVERGRTRLRISFDGPQTIALISERVISRQFRPWVHVRALHIRLPARLHPEKPLTLRYRMSVATVPTSNLNLMRNLLRWLAGGPPLAWLDPFPPRDAYRDLRPTDRRSAPPLEMLPMVSVDRASLLAIVFPTRPSPRGPRCASRLRSGERSTYGQTRTVPGNWCKRTVAAGQSRGVTT